jgi:hypothetical protein
MSSILRRVVYHAVKSYVWPTALLSLRKKACCGFLSPLKKIYRLRPGFNPRTLWAMALMLTARPSRTTHLPMIQPSHHLMFNHPDNILWRKGFKLLLISCSNCPYASTERDLSVSTDCRSRSTIQASHQLASIQFLPPVVCATLLSAVTYKVISRWHQK